MGNKHLYAILATVVLVTTVGCGKKDYEEYQTYNSNGKQGYLDKMGKVVIPPKYDQVGSFDSKGYAKVVLYGVEGKINAKGEWIGGSEPQPPTPEELEAKAFQDLKNRALNGDGNSATEVGLYYSDGVKAPQDYSEAAKWFLLADRNGDVRGTYKLARLYLAGEVQGVSLGETQDMAASLLQKASVRDYPPAQLMYANMLYHGAAYGSLRRNPREAYYWAEKAYNSGDQEISEQARQLLGLITLR